MRSHRLVALALLVPPALPAFAAPGGKTPERPMKAADQTRELARKNDRFAKVELKVDLAGLGESERRALGKLVQAAKVMDGIYLRQVWAGNPTLLLDLAADRSPLGQERLRAFLINKGPWHRLDHNQPFVPGAPEKPAGGAFYPIDARKAELEAWHKSLTDGERAVATGFFTTIRRDGGRLRAVPYSLEYQPELEQAAALLREAAAATSNASLKRFLESRAKAFLSNDYYDSDVAWMELDGAVEPTIGPYEVYEDEWFNAKAAFESFITVRDEVETRKLARFSAELQGLEDQLPIEARYRNPKLGALAPIRVVNEIYCSGDANHGVQTAAFNLPNDERVAREKGTKRVMLKNVQQAKFERVLRPIAALVLGKADRDRVAFAPFFTHILMHELMHGLGPHQVIGKGGTGQTVRGALEETYSAIEEAKADISGLWALQVLIDRGVVEKEMERTLYVTFLASAFRSIRFGINEAHGRGQALQLNFLLDRGAVEVRGDGTFAVVEGKIKAAVRELTALLLTLQAEGDRAQAKKLLAELGVVRPPVQKALDRLAGVPVDIEPIFVTAQELLR